MITILRTIVWFIYFWLYLIVVWPMQRKGEKALKNGDWATSDAMVAKYVDPWARRLMRLAGVKVTLIGEENIPKDRACVFVANHRSYYDVPLSLTQLGEPHALLSKVEISHIPFVYGWMKMLHCVFVDRDDVRASMTALKEATDNVKKGYSITIFPEGTRYKGEEGGIGEFKGGAFRIATKAGAPLVPVAISNSRAVFETNHYFMKPANVTVRILPAIETSELTKEQLKELPAQVQELIHANLDANLNRTAAVEP